MPDIAVYHLVRAANGPDIFKEFLDSYIRFPAGCDHSLILVCKGFAQPIDMSAYDTHLHELDYASVHVDDTGYDLTGYYKTIHRFDHRYCCFLHSFSRILAEDWLAKLALHARREEVGVVGATGSWETALSWETDPDIIQQRSWHTVLRERARRLWYRRYFTSFPNPHIRTNAFMIARDRMLGLQHGRIETKHAAYCFENGRRSMTRQLQRLGLKTLVVGRDGAAYDVLDWPRSNTFRHGEQRNLLVADNRTQSYLDADTMEQVRQERVAWGEQA